jgi:aryl-alcohol dehydrogenase-like predicted oxidoreductase
MDCVDIYQVHWPSRVVPFSETAAALDRLQAQGKIRCWGVSNFGKHDLTEALQAGRPEVDQLPYSLLWRAVEHDIVPLCMCNSVSILCYSPLAQGILSGKFASAADVPAPRRRARYCSDRFIGLAFAVVSELRAVSEQMGEPMAAVALAWLMGRPGVCSVIAGMRTPDQARENARAADLSLPQDVITRLDQASQSLKEALGTNPDMWQEDAESRYR